MRYLKDFTLKKWTGSCLGYWVGTKVNRVLDTIAANIFQFKVNSGNIKTMCKTCAKFTIKIPGQRRSGVFIADFEQIPHNAQEVWRKKSKKHLHRLHT